MEQLIRHIEQLLSEHFNHHIEIKNTRQVFGGDINHAFEVQTNGDSYFLKLNEGTLKDMFEKEFDGLQLLYQTNSIRIPQPILQGSFGSNIFLVTEFVQKGNASTNSWKIFAEKLASLHRHSGNQFGLQTDNYIGSLPQQNTRCNSWAEFYSNYRIMPLMQKAFEKNKCSKDDVRLAEKLCKRLDDLFPKEQPALIHGDLWGGNYLNDPNGEPVIFDPAVYYGSREMDIAMSLLFGGFDNSFYDHYNEVFKLPYKWKERIQLWQLYYLLVHLILFGGHYYDRAMSIIKDYI